jgi:hypothetical protein
MSPIVVGGWGAVSPAGWSASLLWSAVHLASPIPATELTRPSWKRPIPVRRVSGTAPKPVAAHTRLRRASAIAQFAVSAGLEALGRDTARLSDPAFRLGVILCVMTGCVNYSRRFYDEILRDPAMASPILFPETVFNAPASHIAALLGAPGLNYTLVGDPGMFLVGLATAADWLMQDRVDGCLVIGAEETDWLTIGAFQLFQRNTILSEGAGALYLHRAQHATPAVKLVAVTDAHSYTEKMTQREAARRMRDQLPPPDPSCLLCDGLQELGRLDAAEFAAWEKWTGPRISSKRILGEGLAAGSAWQCVAAIEALQQGQASAAHVSIVGCNQQAIGAHFSMRTPH